MIIEYGVGQYEASWNKIEAEWYMEAFKARKKELSYGGFGVTADDGGYIIFPHIHNVPRNAGIAFYAGTDAVLGGKIEIRDSNPEGALLGVCDIRNPQQHLIAGYDYYTCELKNPGGETNLCLVFRGKAGKNVITLDWFKIFDRNF